MSHTLSHVCVCVCDNFNFVFSSLQILAANDTGCFIQKCFRLICSNVRPLNLTEQMFLFSKQIARRLISQKQLPLKKKQEQERRCFLSLWVALKTGTWKKYTKTEGSWQCFVRPGNDKLKKKGLKARRHRSRNAKLRIIRKEIYCTYSKAVTPCLLQESNAVLIKEVNHFAELWHVVWLPPPKNQTRC